MDAANFYEYVSLLLGLSVASERLVEIIKGAIPWLNLHKSDPKKEGLRRALLHLLAAVAGVVTAILAGQGGLFPNTKIIPILGVGLLVSGGSGLWNSILTYLTNVKDIKKREARALVPQFAPPVADAAAAGQHQ